MICKWKPFQADMCLLGMCHHYFSTFKIFVTRCSRLILYFFWPSSCSLRIAISKNLHQSSCANIWAWMFYCSREESHTFPISAMTWTKFASSPSITVKVSQFQFTIFKWKSTSFKHLWMALALALKLLAG